MQNIPPKNHRISEGVQKRRRKEKKKTREFNKGSSREHPRKWIFLHCFDLKILKFSPLTKKKIVILRGVPPRKTLQGLRKAALRVARLSRCQGVFTKRCHYNYFCHYCHFYYYHNLSFWVATIHFFSFAQFEFLNLVTIWSFKFCHNLFFWVLSQFEFLSFAAIFFIVLSQFDFF